MFCTNSMLDVSLSAASANAHGVILGNSRDMTMTHRFVCVFPKKNEFCFLDTVLLTNQNIYLYTCSISYIYILHLFHWNTLLFFFGKHTVVGLHRDRVVVEEQQQLK